MEKRSHRISPLPTSICNRENSQKGIFKNKNSVQRAMYIEHKRHNIQDTVCMELFERSTGRLFGYALGKTQNSSKVK